MRERVSEGERVRVRETRRVLYFEERGEDRESERASER